MWPPVVKVLPLFLLLELASLYLKHTHTHTLPGLLFSAKSAAHSFFKPLHLPSFFLYTVQSNARLKQTSTFLHVEQCLFKIQEERRRL